MFRRFLLFEKVLSFSITKSGEIFSHSSLQLLSILNSLPPIKSIPRLIGFLNEVLKVEYKIPIKLNNIRKDENPNILFLFLIKLKLNDVMN